MLIKGTLIRVKDCALKIDRVEKDGTLWIITDERIPHVQDLGFVGAYRCKSLATGERWTWFADEFDTEENEDT